MSNRVTLADLPMMPDQQVQLIPLDQLELLQQDLADLTFDLSGKKAALERVLESRFGNAATTARQAIGKNTGTVHLNFGSYTVECNLGKHIDWDQAKLRHAVHAIKAIGEPVEDYVEVEIKVMERRFASWPASLRRLFEAARTVRPGKAKYTLIPVKEAA